MSNVVCAQTIPSGENTAGIPRPISLGVKMTDEEINKLKNAHLFPVLPPIIKDLVVSVYDNKTPIHNRDLVCARLESIQKCCADAIEDFKKKQTKHYAIKAKQKA